MQLPDILIAYEPERRRRVRTIRVRLYASLIFEAPVNRLVR